MNGLGLLAILGAYGLGCVNAGYYLVRWRTGHDIRSLGSGNAGARNVGRMLGRPAFLATFVLDSAKGAAAVIIGTLVSAATPFPGLCGLVAVAGHVWPIQLRGQGGKGVATGIGMLLALAVLRPLPELAFAFPVLAALLAYTHRSNISAWRRRAAPSRRGA